VVDYYLIRAHGNILLMDQLDVIGRTSELARLFGIQFYEVLTRGSQFRVESIMLRLVKARNYIPISSSVQVGLWKITYHPIAKKKLGERFIREMRHFKRQKITCFRKKLFL
jgi:hypothetical protein